MEMIAIFCALSMLIGILALKKPSVFLVVIVAVFFPYYFLIGLLNVKLDEGGTGYILASFLLVLLIYLFFRKMLICRTKVLFTINSLDVLYISYCSLWFIVFLINLNHSLFVYKPYVQALFWLTITFVLPIILKPIYSQTTISDFVRYLEWLGYFAALAVFICLLSGITSKETLEDYEIVNLSEAFRYAPFRGFFSIRQAQLLSISIIIFISKAITDKLSKKKIAIRIPFIILCFLGIIISGSRGPFIFLCLLCFYLVVSVKRFKRRIVSIVIAFVGIVLCGIYFYIPSYTHLFSRVFEPSWYTLEVGGIDSRCEKYKTGLRNFIEQPLIGNGMSRMCDNYDYSHSTIISALEDTGLLGFSIICLMVVLLFHTCKWRYSKQVFAENQFVIRNMIIFLFLLSNLYGTISSDFPLFLLIHVYYCCYRKQYHRAIEPNPALSLQRDSLSELLS
jgi:hypothetical protein